MNLRSRRIAASSTFAGFLVLLLSSCASRQAPSQPSDALNPPGPPLKYRIAQVSFGRDASFALCAEPACPTVTKKTIATRPLEISDAVQPVSDRDIVPVVSAVRSAPTTGGVDLSPQLAQARPPSRIPDPDPSSKHVVVNFAFASAELSPGAKKALLGSLQLARTAETIVISGRTDSIGDLKVNESLALARSMAVRNYLRDVAPDLGATIAIDAKGRCCFIAPNSDERGRSQNRRVQIVFVAPKGVM